MFFADSRPDRRKRADREISGAERLRRLASSPVPPAKAYELFGLDEVLHSQQDRIAPYDVESYPNYWLCSFRCLQSKKVIYFEVRPDGYAVNNVIVAFSLWQQYLTYILHRWCIVGFNSRTYDLPMVLVALQGVNTEKLFEVGNDIITNELQPYQVEQKYNVRAPNVNHIDLIEVAPISAPLKIYGGRLHCERMQDLPYEVGSYLTPEQALHVRDYNINDLDITEDLYWHILPHIQMREELGRKYEVDLRSKSDAQIAETMIAIELERIGVTGSKPNIPDDWTFKYNVPEWLRFESPQLFELVELLGALDFEIGSGGKPKFPRVIEEFKSKTGKLKVLKKEKDGKRSYSIEIDLRGRKYNLAMGGLHSMEESVFYKADDKTLLIDRDVASFYPYIILNNKLFPKHLGEAFLAVYRDLVERRLHAKAKVKECKKKGDTAGAEFWSTEADGLKIAINGIFGKLGNKYSKVYAPDLLAHVTLTGQLALLMLIDMAGSFGVEVISANTDGIVMRCAKKDYQRLEDAITMWEAYTEFVTEETRYSALYSRDVNNYIAIKELEGGANAPEVKTKGAFSERGSAQNSVLSKNPEAYICSEAVQEFLANGTPLTETILACRDIRKFVSVRSVKGGAEKDGVFLGKGVRWYYAKDEEGTINYAMSGNKVPKSEGARPLMTMPTALPIDLDTDWYINEATDILYQLGYYQREKPVKFF